MGGNPFRIRTVVEAPYFTDRADEVARIAEALRTPAARLLVYGPRRMGKTSAILAAARKVERGGGVVLVADLSTATTTADAANRLLEAAGRALGRRWKDASVELARRVALRLTVRPEGGGLLVPSLELGLRRASESEQREALGRVLDAVQALAAERGRTVGVVLDEFQDLQRLGGEEAEWHLRGHMQGHGELAYVLAGSETRLIERMLEKSRAFYKMLGVLHFGPMDAAHVARWIDSRLEGAGVAPSGAGERAVALAGPRTQDVVQLAGRTYEVGRDAGKAGPAEVEEAFGRIVAEEADLIRALWERLTPLQQNVLRAVSWGGEGLTTGATIERFGLGSTGSATNAATALVASELLVRAEGGSGYAFDSPFVRGWVVGATLGDVGPDLPQTHVPASGAASSG